MKRMKIKSEYDLTRKMLKTLRTITESQSNKSTLTENINVNNAEQNLDNGIVVVNDVDVRLQSDDKNDLKLTSAQETTISGLIDNFRSQVSEIVDFNPGFTMSGKQIRLDGYLTDNDISFVLIAGEEEGAYVNAEMMKLDTEVGNLLEKLAKFQDTFKSTLEPIITERQHNIFK